jgi:hypothetical protein
VAAADARRECGPARRRPPCLERRGQYRRARACPCPLPPPSLADGGPGHHRRGVHGSASSTPGQGSGTAGRANPSTRGRDTSPGRATSP